MASSASRSMAWYIPALGFSSSFSQPLLADTPIEVATGSCADQCRLVMEDCKELSVEVRSGTMEGLQRCERPERRPLQGQM